ncbi:MAG: peptidyl-prolyl cis-trans isomerase [Magnetospirillum sp.]|nr:peptidyl-prolyl cis-trans isomerase [Magnetospirillum sp.]
MKTSAARRGALALGLAASLATLPALAADKDPVVAVVNGTDVHASAMTEFRKMLPPQMQGAPFPMLLDVYINNMLVTDAAKKDGMQNDPAVKREVKTAEEQIMRAAWMRKKLNADVTDAMLKERYDQFVAQFKPQEEIRARHILVESEDQAKAIIADLKSGAKFEDIAKAKSKDPSAQQNGGELGYFTKAEMVPQFADAAFNLKAGEISQPVKTQFGWHVIEVEDRRMSSPPSFDEAKPMLREQVSGQMAQKIVGELRDKAKVKRFNQDGTPMADEPAAKK